MYYLEIRISYKNIPKSIPVKLKKTILTKLKKCFNYNFNENLYLKKIDKRNRKYIALIHKYIKKSTRFAASLFLVQLDYYILTGTQRVITTPIIISKPSSFPLTVISSPI